jgi:hypothetical protein
MANDRNPFDNLVLQSLHDNYMKFSDIYSMGIQCVSVDINNHWPLKIGSQINNKPLTLPQASGRNKIALKTRSRRNSTHHRRRRCGRQSQRLHLRRPTGSSEQFRSSRRRCSVESIRLWRAHRRHRGRNPTTTISPISRPSSRAAVSTRFRRHASSSRQITPYSGRRKVNSALTHQFVI